MIMKNFRVRFLEAFEASGLSMAELSRRSGVPYHTIHKLKSRETATTGQENAAALARELGIEVDTQSELEEVRSMLAEIDDPEQRRTAVAAIRGVLQAYRRRD
ncbi:MAG: helix-turn-helix transcriptional regulator [Parvularcula sp.]|nr:helix-turn-helix transcriptional regulator [Parvularcula sp.]